MRRLNSTPGRATRRSATLSARRRNRLCMREGLVWYSSADRRILFASTSLLFSRQNLPAGGGPVRRGAIPCSSSLLLFALRRRRRRAFGSQAKPAKMSVGSGTVLMPIFRRVLLGTCGLFTVYVTADLFGRPLVASVSSRVEKVNAASAARETRGSRRRRVEGEPRVHASLR